MCTAPYSDPTWLFLLTQSAHTSTQTISVHNGRMFSKKSMCPHWDLICFYRTKVLFQKCTKCKRARNFDHLRPVFPFYPSGCNTFTCDFTCYYVKTVPGALNSFPLPMSLLFCFAARTLHGIHLYSSLPLNMIHSKTISAPAFCIIALAQTQTVEILPLD